ncbi:hypothetical protein KUV89_16540 [Marinobacter hydrocarbonoclasticus]|nr:hypothetical protein [Marinobacter nauticus]
MPIKMHRTFTSLALIVSLAACGSTEEQRTEQPLSFADTASVTDTIDHTQPAVMQCQPDEVAVDFGCLPLEPQLAEMANTFEWTASDLVATCLDPDLPEVDCEMRYSEDNQPHDIAVLKGELAVDEAHNNGSGSLNFEMRKDELTEETTLTLDNHTWDVPASCDAAHLQCESVFTLVKANGDTEELGRAATNEILTLKLSDSVAARMSGTVRLEVTHYEAGNAYSTDAFITPRAEFVAAVGRMRVATSEDDNERALAD